MHCYVEAFVALPWQRHNTVKKNVFNKMSLMFVSVKTSDNITSIFIQTAGFFCTCVGTCRWGHEASRVGSSSSGSNSGFSLGGRVRKIFTEIYFKKKRKEGREGRTEKVGVMRQKGFGPNEDE